MARTRRIRPAFFTNEDVVELDFATRLLFIGLWTLADRAGRLEDRPKRIRMALFPADDVDVPAGLAELAARGLIQRYRVGDGAYIQVTNFTKHQAPHPNEAPSVIPPPGSTMVNPEDDHGDTSGAPWLEPANLELELDTSPHGDAPPGEPIELNGPYAAVAAMCEVLGTDPHVLDNKALAKQCRKAKELLDRGVSLGEIRDYTTFLVSQDWRDEPPDMFTVARGIDKWRLNGRPPAPRNRGSPRQQTAEVYTGLNIAAYLREIDEEATREPD